MRHRRSVRKRRLRRRRRSLGGGSNVVVGHRKTGHRRPVVILILAPVIAVVHLNCRVTLPRSGEAAGERALLVPQTKAAFVFQVVEGNSRTKPDNQQSIPRKRSEENKPLGPSEYMGSRALAAAPGQNEVYNPRYSSGVLIPEHGASPPQKTYDLGDIPPGSILMCHRY